MEKQSMYRSDNPGKISHKGEYKVQFTDASEYYKGRNSTILGKPPEIPRSSSSSLKYNGRPYSSTSSSIGNLNSCYTSSLNTKHSKGSSASNTCKADTFGSTTSLDRRRCGSSRRRQLECTLQPITDVTRSESLVEYKRQDSSPGDPSHHVGGSRRKRELLDSSEKKSKIRSLYTGSSSRSISGDRSCMGSRYKTRGSDDIKTLQQNNERPDDWIMKVKRAASRSPIRKNEKSHNNRATIHEKENNKGQERASRYTSERRFRERGRSLKRLGSSGPIPSDQCNNNLDEVWSFEPGVMWSRTLSNRRIGYLLFNCSNLDTPPADSYPAKFNMTYKFSPQAESKLIRLVLEAHGFTEVNSSSSRFNLYWSSAHFNPNEIRNLQDWQKVNHFPRSSELTRKDRLYLNIKRMQRQFGIKLFDFIPTSFVLPTEHREFCETHLRERGTWIVKPVASSQGKGIYLVSQVDQVSPDESSLVSRYIESPLLVNGFKCDLRLYVAVTSLDPLLVYMFEEGLVRLATVKYQHKKNLWNPCIHLTNYSVNKFHSNYVHNQDAEVDDEGSKWSLSAFLRHLRGRGIDTAALMRSVEDVVIKSLLAAAYQMNTAAVMFMPHPRNCFELYGFDILIDEQLKPWVLEVNLSPSLNIDQPLDLKIKSSMLADLFSLAGILICNPSTSRLSTRPSMNRKLPSLRHSTETYERQAGRSGAPASSLEELRLLRQVMEEQQRRGGWARIFPTPDSWSSYGGLQEYDSPLNLMLHTHLYPHVQRNTRLRVVRCSSVSTSSGLASSLERLTCYERPLPKGLAFIKDKLGIGKSHEEQEQRSPQDAHAVKQNLLEALDNGLKLSKYQARMAFSVYLQHVQRRLMIGCDEENQTDLVYRFLRSASRTLHLPISVQSPSKNLPEEARAVVISKQLGDFIMAYTKETQTHHDPPPPASRLSVDAATSRSSVPGIPSSTDGEDDCETSMAATSVASSIATISLPSHSNVTYASCAMVSEYSDKSVRFSTTAHKTISRFPSTSSFSDVTPSDVNDPLNPLLPPRRSSEADEMVGSVSSSGFSDTDQPGDNPSSGSTLLPSLLISSDPSCSDGDSCVAMSSSGCSWRTAEDDGEDVQHVAACSQAPPAGHQQQDVVAMELYRAFMSAAKETDLEEVLALQTKLHNSAGMFLDSARRSVNSSSNRAGGGSSSRPRTPNASPHGSPRRGRKSPSMHGSQSRMSEQSAPVTSEAQVTSSLAVLPERSSLTTSSLQTLTTTTAATAKTPPQSSSCCLFGNILKASLKGTNTSFNV
ncbi:uncharacterized protein LOC108682243 [Hyalella azteca]|uniref:Tubulin--tyrosine ligase-like protein 5 n=1 Tax=Hyalella azteca TaxID=294128 RepID=A0A8B7PL09_HYAAZ|nr:uncharacterized protein LOC108682243 [Hyalella azteca]